MCNNYLKIYKQIYGLRGKIENFQRSIYRVVENHFLVVY